MRVLVTGGAGFVGSHIVAQALLQGLEVAVLDNFSSGKRGNVPAGVRTFDVDLRNREATLAAVAEFRPEVVSHQAAQTSVPVSMKDPRLDAEINIVGGLNLLDACTLPESRVRHLVFASTGGTIYGEVPEATRASEAFALEPTSPYGISKLAFERLLEVYRRERGLTTTVLRYANVYGPRQDPHGEAGVVAIFFKSALVNKKLTVFARKSVGDGGCVRDYVFVSDVARANLAALTGQLSQPVMNVGSGMPTTTLELAQQIIRLTGSGSSIEQRGVRVGDIGRSLIDPSRYREALGAPTPLAPGLDETARWYRER